MINENSFAIEGDKFEPMVIDLLIYLTSRQRAMEQFILERHAEKTGEDFGSLTKLFDDMSKFHKEEFLKQAFTNYGSIKDILPPENS